jgi:ribosome biogenesis protein MAK21
MQPAAGDAISGGGVRLIKGEVGNGLDLNSRGGVTVNDEKWWKRRVEDVPIDQVFFHKYFNQKNELEKARATKSQKRKKGKGAEEGCSEVEENEVAEEGSEKSNDEDEEGEIWTVSEKETQLAVLHSR